MDVSHADDGFAAYQHDAIMVWWNKLTYSQVVDMVGTIGGPLSLENIDDLILDDKRFLSFTIHRLYELALNHGLNKK